MGFFLKTNSLLTPPPFSVPSDDCVVNTLVTWWLPGGVFGTRTGIQSHE